MSERSVNSARAQEGPTPRPVAEGIPQAASAPPAPRGTRKAGRAPEGLRNGPTPVRETLPPPPPAASQRTPARPTSVRRTFAADGRTWEARLAGRAAGGTGRSGAAYMVAVHFSLEDDKAERPLREALLPRGRLETLFDEELVELLHRAVEIPAEDAE